MSFLVRVKLTTGGPEDHNHKACSLKSIFVSLSGFVKIETLLVLGLG